MGTVALFAVVVGFGRTYAAPMVRGTFTGPRILHVHGALAFSWVVLFCIQPLLVRWRKTRLHRRLGLIGLPLALGVAITMVPAGVFQVTRDSATGGPAAISALLGVVTSGALFLVLVSAGIIARHDRESHSRWLLLATLVVIWPAWFRFRHWFPSVPRPDVWFGVVLAFAWIVIAMLRDWRTRGNVHPVLAFGGTAVIIEQSLELLAFDTPWWRAAAHLLYGWIHS